MGETPGFDPGVTPKSSLNSDCRSPGGPAQKAGEPPSNFLPF